jgi:hypothetical protein
MKRALCVGINDYPVAGADLKGCVNDAKAWAALLIDHFDFDPKNVSDAARPQATKKRKGRGPFAVCRRGRGRRWFTNSSHGTYVADRVMVIESRYDEAMPMGYEEEPDHR